VQEPSGTAKKQDLTKRTHRSSLFARQLRWGLLIALALGVLIMLSKGFSDYRDLWSFYDKTNERVLTSTVPVAGNAVQTGDVELAMAAIRGAMVSRTVVSVRLLMADRTVLAQQQYHPDLSPSGRWQDDLFGGIVEQDVVLYAHDRDRVEQVVVGELQMTFSPKVYVAILCDRIKQSFLAVFILALFMAFGMVGVSYFIVNKPLLQLIDYMVNVNPVETDKDLPMPPPYRHDDEIQMLRSSLIGLFALIRSKVEKLANVTDALQASNQTLEIRVEQRTRELNDVVEKLEFLAATDPLTGLANRRALMGRLKNAVAVWKRRGTRVGLIILDLDHFKALNDTYGHQTGDVVLKSLAGVFARVLRETDLPARMGGEEFAVLISDEDEDGLRIVAERLRKAVAEDVITVNDQTITCTVSIGIACLPVKNETEFLENDGVDSVLRQAREVESIIDVLYFVADRALYAAKAKGRNRFEMGELSEAVLMTGE
jgi:diguanylate cyclase (GGDEF)-like protein|tara:strand:- start:1622 stop:3076 length:1455 start_codon:yes stop_codon:yes gene_type:complete